MKKKGEPFPNIIWHNPPFSKNVKTNVGKHFFTLVKKHFGENHKYREIFIKKNMKISYSCMNKMKSKSLQLSKP